MTGTYGYAIGVDIVKKPTEPIPGDVIKKAQKLLQKHTERRVSGLLDPVAHQAGIHQPMEIKFKDHTEDDRFVLRLPHRQKG